MEGWAPHMEQVVRPALAEQQATEARVVALRQAAAAAGAGGKTAAEERPRGAGVSSLPQAD